MRSLASEPFPNAGKHLFGPSFEEKVKKRNEMVKIFSQVAPRKSNMQFFSERDLLPIQVRARGSISWKMVKSPTKLPNQGEKLILQRPGPGQGEIPGCSTRSELCSTLKSPVTVASQSNTGMLPVKENLTLPKVKLFFVQLRPFFCRDQPILHQKLTLGKFQQFQATIFPLQSYHTRIFFPLTKCL